ncbi:MAG TPA: hypothetical protein DFS52_02130 [Myxococcales bacterium]|mgnify:CR=1 FL=1|nr:hypothetical protein [Myxococcales bacterium]
MNSRSFLLATLLLAACGPSGSPPVDVVALVFNPQTGRYEPRQVQLTTPTDLVEMKGPILEFHGGASFDYDANDPALANAGSDAAKISEAMTKDKGSPVKVAYIDREGVLVPADFHSLNIVTSYYNFERAFDFFALVGGLNAESIGRRKVYYFPEFKLLGATLRDNAIFFPPMQAFMILPFDALKQVPLAINLGVVGHEYSHAVFNYRLFDADPLPRVYEAWYSEVFATPGLNLLESLDEGFADLFGTGITCSSSFSTCDTGFMAHSVPDKLASARRVDGIHCLSDALGKALSNQDSKSFSDAGNEYLVGSVLASSLWRAAEDSAVVEKLTPGEARRQVFEGAFKSLGEGSSGIRGLVANATNRQPDFRLESGAVTGVLEIIVASMTDPMLQSAVCSAFADRFNMPLERIKGCPATAAPFTDCNR